jgi:hypothetical protein
MRNKLNKLSKRVTETQRADLKAAFRSACTSALRQKKLIKNIEDYKAFVDLLFALENQFETLCEETIRNVEDKNARRL